MKNGFVVSIAALIALGLSWCGFVLAPVMQLGTEKQATVLNSSELYPVGRPGEANQGLQVYCANGCAACHTEQVRQDGVTCYLDIVSYGKNRTAVVEAMEKIAEQISLTNPRALEIERLRSAGSPEPFLNGVTKENADTAAEAISVAGGKTEIRIGATGADIWRGWGVRQSVAADFLYDYPVQLGSLRAGPDLANIGIRAPDLNWQLVHLYAPQALVKNSTMPPFRFLFEVRKIGGAPSPDALQFPKAFAPPAGCEVVPKPEAKQLAAYLSSLRADAPLYEAPFTPVMTKP
jgi:cytochrome c oxidase cbb3-type subunit 2